MDRNLVLEKAIKRLQEARREREQAQHIQAYAQLIAHKMDEDAVFLFLCEDEKTIVITSHKRVTTIN